MPAFGDNNIGVALRRLDEHLVHGLDRGQILRDDRLQVAAAVAHVAHDAPQDAHIGIRVDKELDVQPLAQLGLGIAGAGLATGLSYLLAAAIGLVYFARFSRTLRLVRAPLRPRVLLCASYNGLSEMVTQLSVGVTTFLFNLMTFAYMGEDGVAAISVILYAEMLLTSLLLGFTNGVAPHT